MTTPEAFRRRQRIEGTALVILGVFTILISLYFRHEDKVQRACVNDYIMRQAETSQIRAKVVEEESLATRNILLNGTSVKTRAEFQKVRDRYVLALHQIDEERGANPVRSFKPGTC